MSHYESPYVATAPYQTGPLMPENHAYFNRRPLYFCMECGATLLQGATFCMECGTEVGSTTPPDPANSTNQNHTQTPSGFVPTQGGGTSSILLVGILLLTAAIILLVSVILFTQGDDQGVDQAVPTTETDQSSDTSLFDEEDDGQPVDLTRTYTTDSLIARPIAYPVFKFGYPDGWNIEDGWQGESYEMVEVTDRYSSSLTYSLFDPDYSLPYSVRVGNIEKVADCALRFDGASARDSAQSYVVAKFDIRKSDSQYFDVGDSVLAIVPKNALDDPSSIDFSTGLPGFKHGYTISFCMKFEPETILARRFEEATAILASFSYVKEVAASESSTFTWDAQEEYILPYSNVAPLDDADLAGLSAYELYLARNEIYARHGRKFNNADLTEYFNSQSWYIPSIDPEDFNDGMLNAIERENLQTILAKERALGSPYI